MACGKNTKATSEQFWKARASRVNETSGQPPSYTPEELAIAAGEYFEWVEAHPLKSFDLVTYQGVGTLAEVPKLRAMTIGGLCIFLDITQETFFKYRGMDAYSEVCLKIEQTVREQKFAGAAAGLLNHAIIARDLGLVDKSKVEVGVDDQLAAAILAGRQRVKDAE